MSISTSLSDVAVCEVLMEALTLDGYGARCTAAVIGNKYTFTLEYPLEPVVQVAAKTAQHNVLFLVSSKLISATASENAPAAHRLGP